MNYLKKTFKLFSSITLTTLITLFLSTHSYALYTPPDRSSLLFRTVNSDYIEEKLRIEGKIPNFINGSIYRNGFGKFEGHNFKFNHLFDSLSLILKFEIVQGNVYFQSRLLNSKYYNDSLQEIPLYRTLGGTNPNMNFKEKVEAKMHFMHDNLNANIIMMKDKLLAISDLAGDIVIDKENLKYQGKYTFKNDFKNDEKSNFITSAHPEKWSFDRNIIINYEADLEKMVYKFYYIDLSDGTDFIEKKYFVDIPTTRFSYIHSFSLTKRYIVFIEYPFYWDIESIIDSVVILPSLKWDSKAKTKIHIINLDYSRPDIITIETEPFFSFHHINAFDFYNNVSDNKYANPDADSDCTNIFLELITYPDAKIFESFYMNKLLNITNSDSLIKGGNYSKIIINIDNRHKISYFKMFTNNINNETIEMPTVNPNYKGNFYKYFYAFTESAKLIKVDIISGNVLEWKKTKHIPSEPIFIPYNNNNNKTFNRPSQNYANANANNNTNPNGSNSCLYDFIDNNIYKSSELYSKYEKYYQRYIKKYGSDFNEDDGVIVSVVLDVINTVSYLLFLDAKTMTEIAKGYMTTHIPLTCHGFFQSN